MTSHNKVPNHLMNPETVDYQFAIQNMESVVTGLPGQEGEQPPQVIRLLRLLHSRDGICTEAGEYANAFKRHVYYHQPLDETNLIEELGDIMWYVALACNVLGVTIGAVQIANIRKLQKRYPEKFTVECATNRNVTAEIDALLDKAVAFREEIDELNTPVVTGGCHACGGRGLGGDGETDCAQCDGTGEQPNALLAQLMTTKEGIDESVVDEFGAPVDDYVPLSRTDVIISRNSFHPGTLKSGWSQLHISGEDAGRVNQDIFYLMELGWESWVVGQDGDGKPAAVLFRSNAETNGDGDKYQEVNGCSLPSGIGSPLDKVGSSVEDSNDKFPDGPARPKDARLAVSLASGETQNKEFGLGTVWKHKVTGVKGKVVGRAGNGITSGLPWNNNWFALLEMEVPFKLAIMAIRDRGFATASVVDPKGIHQVGVKRSDLVHWEPVK